MRNHPRHLPFFLNWNQSGRGEVFSTAVDTSPHPAQPLFLFFISNVNVYLTNQRRFSMSDGLLTNSWRSRLIHRNRVDQLICFRCGEEIKLGERIHTNGNNMHTSIKPIMLKSMKIYHYDCLKEIIIECWAGDGNCIHIVWRYLPQNLFFSVLLLNKLSP